jgi:quinol monooxygenase YgiN
VVSERSEVRVPAVELVRFRVAPDKVEALLEARPRMLADFRADRTGFIEARLIRLPDDEWLDLVVWRSADDFAASRAKGANLPGIAAYFEAIQELVSAEEGTLADGADSSQPVTGIRRRRRASRGGRRHGRS